MPASNEPPIGSFSLWKNGLIVCSADTETPKCVHFGTKEEAILAAKMLCGATVVQWQIVAMQVVSMQIEYVPAE